MQIMTAIIRSTLTQMPPGVDSTSVMSCFRSQRYGGDQNHYISFSGRLRMKGDWKGETQGSPLQGNVSAVGPLTPPMLSL